MRFSTTGLRWLKEFEGWRDHVYPDSDGNPTIGYGHLIKEGESFPARITKRAGEKILEADVIDAEMCVDNAFLQHGHYPSQHEFDAMVLLTFNIGCGAFKRSTLFRLMREGKYMKASHEFQRWCKAGGRRMTSLLRRRLAEECIFNGCSETAIRRAYDSTLK